MATNHKNSKNNTDNKVPNNTTSCTPDSAVQTLDLMHPRKLFLRGLAKLNTDSAIEWRKAELERAFRRYGGPRGITVVAPKQKSFAFLEFESAAATTAALREMASQYCLIRARYTRQEALEAQRAAKQTAAPVVTPDRKI